MYLQLFCDNILNALTYLHDMKLVHNDIKPENIFITRDSYDARLVMAKLIDFGIARNLCEQSKPAQYISGDPRYMAPEQFMGRSVPAALRIRGAAILFLQHPGVARLVPPGAEALQKRQEPSLSLSKMGKLPESGRTEKIKSPYSTA